MRFPGTAFGAVKTAPYKAMANRRFYCSSAVGAGHARPGGVRQTGACGKAAGRTCPAPTVRSCFYVEITVSSPGGMNPSPTMKRANRRFYCSSAVGAGHARPGGVRQTGACGKAAGRTCPAPTEARYRRVTGARLSASPSADPPPAGRGRWQRCRRSRRRWQCCRRRRRRSG